MQNKKGSIYFHDGDCIYCCVFFESQCNGDHFYLSGDRAGRSGGDIVQEEKGGKIKMLLLKLFFALIQVGLFSVGGGYAAIPLIQEQIVNKYGLMTLEEFSDLITVAEMTPGPISINSATFVGMRLADIPGVLLCSFGCIIPSFCICLILAHFYYKYRSVSGVQVVLGALRPAVVALIGSAGASILVLGLFQTELSNVAFENIRLVELGIFLVALFILRKFKVSAVAVILGSGVVVTLIYAAMGVV